MGEKASDAYQGVKESAENTAQQAKETLGVAGEKAQRVSVETVNYL